MSKSGGYVYQSSGTSQAAALTTAVVYKILQSTGKKPQSTILAILLDDATQDQVKTATGGYLRDEQNYLLHNILVKNRLVIKGGFLRKGVKIRLSLREGMDTLMAVRDLFGVSRSNISGFAVRVVGAENTIQVGEMKGGEYIAIRVAAGISNPKAGRLLIQATVDGKPVVRDISFVVSGTTSTSAGFHSIYAALSQ